MRVKHLGLLCIHVSRTCIILFNFSIHWNFNRDMWYTARRASWIYEQAGQTPTYNAPDDSRVRKRLEETTGHKELLIRARKRSHVIQVEIIRGPDSAHFAWHKSHLPNECSIVSYNGIKISDETWSRMWITVSDPAFYFRRKYILISRRSNIEF